MAGEGSLVTALLPRVVALYAATAALAAGFLLIYARLACSFMCSLPVFQLAKSVVGVAVVQVVARPLLWRFFPSAPGRSPARQAYRLGVLGWMAAGLLASAIHLWWYPEVDWSSHARLLLGYWLLGAGVLAQAEYLLFERFTSAAAGLPRLSERLGRRLLESYGVFTVVPAAVLVLGIVRMSDGAGDGQQRLYEAIFLGIFCVGAALVVAGLLGRSLQRDARQLQEAVDRIRDGALDTRVQTSRPDELAVVAEGINAMAQGLLEREALRDALGRFTSRDVAERVLTAFSTPQGGLELGGRRVEVTLLLCDLRGFTALTESLAPEQLTGLLNSWFAEAVAAVHAEGGMVDKFIGDAIFAVFGLGGEAGAPAAALRAANDMIARLERWNARRAPGEPTLAVGVAVHTGEVTAGFFGSPERVEFTVIGRAANEVARISDHARPPLPAVLVSESTARLLGEHALERVGELQLKGVSAVMGVFGVRA